MLQELLDMFPPDGKYQMIKDAIARVGRTFPDQLAEIDAADVQRWIAEVDSGTGRDATAIRNDIFRYIVGNDEIEEVLGVSDEEAENLINQTGGAQFFTNSSVAEAGNVYANSGAPLSILYGKNMEWYFDNTANKWYVGYTMPNTDRQLLFEAEADQMDSLFGVGVRPSSYQIQRFSDLIKRTNVTFSGNVSEMEGEGSFEDEYNKVIQLSLDEGRLPSWMENDPAALDALFVAQAEGKDDSWLLTQWSKLPSFQARFPGLEGFRKNENLSLDEAVSGFLEYEAGLKKLSLQYGQSPEAITPASVGALLNKGYDISQVADTFTAFKRMRDHAPALTAFNQVLAEQGKQPMTPEQQVQFLMGEAPQDIYDTYEASSLQESATRHGLGGLFQAHDAIRSALQTPGYMTPEQANAGMAEAAQLLLRLRNEVNLGQYGLNSDDLIDLSLNIKPRSGVAESELQDSISRAVQSAKKWIESSGGQPFTAYGSQGQPYTASLGRARPS